MTSENLIADLIERTRGVLNDAEKLNNCTEDQLNSKAAPDVWSALECIEHLNRYGDFYLEEIQMRMSNSAKEPALEFKSGVLGEYFAKSMLPKEKLNTMKTFSNMNPNGSSLTKRTLENFIGQQHTMLKLLETARSKNLNKVKTSITISKIIKLRLGDTFRVVIYHNQRHLIQAIQAAQFSSNQA